MSALCRTAGSTKYFGTAKARYDFCARDRSELSLKEGDIIKILNKKGQQGWWRGEIYGRVSWGGAMQLQWGCPGWWTREGGQGGCPWLERRKGKRFHVCILHLFIEHLLCAILLGAEEAQKSTAPSLPYETFGLVGSVEL